MKALLLAAGKSASLSPFSQSRPAPMLRLCGRYLLEQRLDLLRQAGVGNVVIVVDDKSAIPSALGDGERYGLSLEYVRQRREGIAGAILDAQEALRQGDHFLLVYGDTLTRENVFREALRSHHEHHAPVASVCLTEHPERYGNIYMTGDMRITKIVERPTSALGNYVLAGAFVLPRTIMGHLERSAGGMYGAMERLMAEESLHASIWEEPWVDLRYPWDILSANRILMDGWAEARIAASARVSPRAMVSGPVVIDTDAEIRAGAIVQGPCYVGPGSFVGHNCLVRPYTSLGARSLVGFGVELKNCVLMDGARVGRLSFIGDSVIGEGVDVGAGTMTINREHDDREITVLLDDKAVPSHFRKLGAFIGDRAIVGSGHSLAPGSVVQAGEGVPNNITYRNKTTKAPQ